MILPRKGTIKILLQGIMIRNKKIFQTEKLNELQQQQKRSLLIFPIIMAVLLIWGGPTSIAGLNGSNFVLGMTGMLLLAALAALVFGIVPFYMRYIRLQGQKKQVLENSSFITIDNIEYYREKLTGITPSAISMLEDLRLEPDKDLTACILRYEMLGVIRQTENGYEKGIETEKETKGYARYEKETLIKVTKLRTKVLYADTIESSYQASELLGKFTSQVVAVGEQYPELKANTNFLQLQRELSETEDKISKARQFYNDTVTKYNDAIMIFPNSILANLFGFRRIALLEAKEPEKEAIKMSADTFQV